ncbi:MAG: ribosomal RNA small subunit methyltransferase I [Candidatus Spyradenecus sp.]
MTNALVPQLYVVATPLGNLADLSDRVRATLAAAPVIACEDTRRTWQLLSALEIPRPEMFSYRQGNEEQVTARIVGFVRSGVPVALCSDGGYPGISDPGYRVLRTFATEGLPYTVLPGPCSVELALLLSGLPTSSYTFKGFPPRKAGALRKFFEQERDLPHTLVCLESPFRLAASLKAAREVFGERECAVCLEMTKVHERVLRGTLSEVIDLLVAHPPKGEATYVIAGANPKFDHSDTQEENL